VNTFVAGGHRAGIRGLGHESVHGAREHFRGRALESQLDDRLIALLYGAALAARREHDAEDIQGYVDVAVYADA
jgi:hypothetical protein